MNILCTTEEFMTTGFPDEFNMIMNPFKRKLTEDEILEMILEHQPVGMIAGIEPLTRKVLINAKNLKVISRCGVGLDSVDLEAASELGILVLNTPDAPTTAVAELTIGLILGLLRHIYVMDRGIREHR